MSGERDLLHVAMAKRLENEPSSKQLNTGELAAAVKPASLGSAISLLCAVSGILVRQLIFRKAMRSI